MKARIAVLGLVGMVAGCDTFSDADRKEYFKVCMDDFASQEYCSCSADEIGKKFTWLEARRFALKDAVRPEDQAKLQEIVKSCAVRVHLAKWPKSGLKGIRQACKGPEESCRCLEETMTSRLEFSALVDQYVAGTLETDARFLEATKEVTRVCPEAFFPPGAPWPQAGTDGLVTGCMQGDEANRAMCECMSKRVTKKLPFTVAVRAGGGDEKAKKELEDTVVAMGTECGSRERLIRTHRRPGGK